MYFNSDSKDNEQCNTQIIPSIEAEQIDFNDYTFNTSIGAETIDCIWFDSQISAYSVHQQTKPTDFEINQDDVQVNGSIICGNQEIHIDDRYIPPPNAWYFDIEFWMKSDSKIDNISQSSE